MREIKIPLGAKVILDSLHNEGYDAYVVGGCVRDSLLGIEPHDWDICTSATPQEVIDILTDYEVIQTGIFNQMVCLFNFKSGIQCAQSREKRGKNF